MTQLSSKTQHKKTAAEWLVDVQAYPDLLEYVPANLITTEMCLAAVRRSRWALAYVPSDFITAEMCLTAVQKDGRALEYVPKHLKTIELCLAALQQDLDAFYYIPETLKKKLIAISVSIIKMNEEKRAKKGKYLRAEDFYNRGIAYFKQKKS